MCPDVFQMCSRRVPDVFQMCSRRTHNGFQMHIIKCNDPDSPISHSEHQNLEKMLFWEHLYLQRETQLFYNKM